MSDKFVVQGGDFKVLKCLKKVIAYQSGTNTVGKLPAGADIEKIDVGIRTGFNGSGAALNIGKAGALDAYMATAKITEASAGVYSHCPNASIDAETTVLATLTDADGTTGDATILLWYSE